MHACGHLYAAKRAALKPSIEGRPRTQSPVLRAAARKAASALDQGKKEAALQLAGEAKALLQARRRLSYGAWAGSMGML